MAASSALALPASAGTDTSTPATVTGHFGGGSEANKPSYWCPTGTVGFKLPDDYAYSAVGTMLDDGHRFVLGPDANPGAPGNQPYVKVIVKAGSEASAGDYVNTEFAAPPVAGQFVWADTNGSTTYNPGGPGGDKSISHIIICAGTTPPPPATGSVKAVKQWSYSPAEVKDLLAKDPTPGTLTFTAKDDVRTPAWGATEKYDEGTKVSVTEDLATAKPPVVPGWDCTVTTGDQWPSFSVDGGQATTTAPTVTIKGDTTVTVTVTNQATCTRKVVPPPPTTSLTVTKQWAYVGAPQGFQLSIADAGALTVTVGGQATGQTWNQAKQGLAVGATATVTEGLVPDPKDPSGYTCRITGAPEFAVNGGGFASTTPQFALAETPNAVVVRNTVTCVATTVDDGEVGDVEDEQEVDDTGDQAVDATEDELAETGADFGPAGLGLVLILSGAALMAVRRLSTR
jgi:hypothetical protein